MKTSHTFFNTKEPAFTLTSDEEPFNMSSHLYEDLHMPDRLNNFMGRSVNANPLHLHGGNVVNRIELPTRIEDTDLDHVVCAIGSVWIVLHRSNVDWQKCALRNLPSDDLGHHDRLAIILGTSNQLLVPFASIPSTKECDAVNAPISLAIATRQPGGRSICTKIFNSDIKKRQQDRIILAARQAIGACQWQVSNSLEEVEFVFVTKRPHHLNTCAIDTILYAWAFILKLEVLPADSRDQFHLDFYDTAFTLVKLALEGKSFLGAVTSFLIQSQFCAPAQLDEAMEALQTYATNQDTLQLVAKEMERDRRAKTNVACR